MSDLLNVLREEALKLVESDLPSAEELQPVVGALIARVDQLEQHVLAKLEAAVDGKTVPLPAPTSAPSPAAPEAAPSAPAAPTAPDAAAAATPAAPDNSPGPDELSTAEQELAVAQARVDALKAGQGASAPPAGA